MDSKLELLIKTELKNNKLEDLKDVITPIISKINIIIIEDLMRAKLIELIKKSPPVKYYNVDSNTYEIKNESSNNLYLKFKFENTLCRISGKPGSVELTEAMYLLNYNLNNDYDSNSFNEKYDQITKDLTENEIKSFDEYIKYLKSNDSNIIQFFDKILALRGNKRREFLSTFVNKEIDNLENIIYKNDVIKRMAEEILGNKQKLSKIVRFKYYKLFISKLEKLESKEIKKVYKKMNIDRKLKDIYDTEFFRQYVYLSFVKYIKELDNIDKDIFLNSLSDSESKLIDLI
jgi:hypothetical protein